MTEGIIYFDVYTYANVVTYKLYIKSGSMVKYYKSVFALLWIFLNLIFGVNDLSAF